MNLISTRALPAIFIFLFSTYSVSAQRTWYDPMKCDTPYVCGRAWNAEIGKTSYHRIPERFLPGLSRAVQMLSTNTAGLSVRFETDATDIQIRYTLASGTYSFVNMAILNHSGIDLYGTDANGATHWIGNHMKWRMPSKAGDTLTFSFPDITVPVYPKRGLIYEAYLPPYNQITWMEVGVPEGSKFHFLHESGEKPLVIYGSSIVQGASPSRPGLMWPTIVKRMTEYPVYNFGFSGSALMEPEIFDMLSEIDAKAFILDPIPNSHNMGDEIVKRALYGVHKIREKSDAPILMIEMYLSPDSILRRNQHESFQAGNRKYREAFDLLKKEGVKNLFYLYGVEIGFTEDSMIESAHPNDLGNMQYAQAVLKKLQEIFADEVPDEDFPPVIQNRVSSYDWLHRHAAVIQRNHTINPQILLIGNSITHNWAGEPLEPFQNGPKSYQKTFGKYRVTNMGFGSDRLENIFWRLYHGELDGCQPEHIFMNVGINNCDCRPDSVARGILSMIRLVRKKQPQASLHWIKIYPAKKHEAWAQEVNSLVEKDLPNDSMLDVLDMNDELSLHDGSGMVDPECFLEGLHPNAKGYDRIAKKIQKVLK